MTTHQLPTYFINHGGGPWPWLDSTAMPVDFAHLADSLRAIPEEIGTKPSAILVVSAHWEAPEFTVQTSPNPPMIYDYYGFPKHTYEIQYPAPGAPAIADRVVELLTAAGIVAHTDDARGFDHGVYAPMHVAFPDAEIPVFQLSLRAGLDPTEHLAAGRALAPLRDENVLIIGSGVPSYHNMRMNNVAVESAAFDAWLTETMVDSGAEARVERLLAWEDAPFARVAHPREEHFLPGMVVIGAAGDDRGHRNYHEERVMGWLWSSGYRFGPTRAA